MEAMMTAIATMVCLNAAFPHSRLVQVELGSDESTSRTFEGINPGFKFTEAIASWNVENAYSASVLVEVRAKGSGFETKWYTVAKWSLNKSVGPRESVKKQGDEFGTVSTDTLELKQPADSVDVRISATGKGATKPPKLKLLTVCFSAPEGGKSSGSTKSDAWGKTVEVPQRGQGNYPNGSVLCSATSVSMMLWHYSQRLDRPELDKDVPEVESNVWDDVYKGAGNWPFNAAYFGSFPGLRGYVSRFESIEDLEAWIALGLPVVCSVSFDVIRGRPLSPTESGHLVVLVGFTEDGDPVFNDPARKNQVRYVYKRADFEKAWLYSKRTVYVLHPETITTPPSHGNWLG